jgi:tetratricopeptide (TPR) repeat protein
VGWRQTVSLSAAGGGQSGTAEATAHLEKAVALAPDSVEYRFSLAYALGLAGRFADSIPQLQKAVELSGGQDWQCFGMLGAVYSRMADRMTQSRPGAGRWIWLSRATTRNWSGTCAPSSHATTNPGNAAVAARGICAATRRSPRRPR